jgi:YggT family protein
VLLITLLLDRNAGVGGLLLLTVMELLKLLINIYLWGIIIQVVLSWLNPDPRHPAARVLAQLTAPLLRPARRLLPPISGVDLSPMLVVVALIFVSLLLQEFLGLWIGLR